MNDTVRSIITRWGVFPREPSQYVFGEYTHDMDDYVKYTHKRQVNKNVNKWLKVICKNLGITEKVTSYFARHSFASALSSAGFSTEYIAEALTHSSTAVTERYLKSLNRDKGKAIQETLMKRVRGE